SCLLIVTSFCHNCPAFEEDESFESDFLLSDCPRMKRYLLFTSCLILLIFWPIQAQENAHSISGSPAGSLPVTPERYTTITETRYLNELALRGLKLDTQGLLVESLDGSQIFAELNRNEGFNPASVTKVATSFAALSKLGPEYHFETAFYADGEINQKKRTLT